MRDNVILKKNCGILMFIPEHKDQNICNKAIDNYSHAIWSADGAWLL